MAAVIAFIFAFAVAGTARADHAGPMTASCTNPEFGYTVSFPSNWYYNLHVEGATSDVSECRYFSSEDFEITPGSEPSGVSIGFSPSSESLDGFEGEPTTVGGRDALISETEVTTPGFEGTYYTYRIDIGDGSTLSAQTVDTWVGPYAENKEILDAMMESLVFGTNQDEESPAPMPDETATPSPTQLPDVAMPQPGTSAATMAATVLGALFVLSGFGLLAARRR